MKKKCQNVKRQRQENGSAVGGSKMRQLCARKKYLILWCGKIKRKSMKNYEAVRVLDALDVFVEKLLFLYFVFRSECCAEIWRHFKLYSNPNQRILQSRTCIWHGEKNLKDVFILHIYIWKYTYMCVRVSVCNR